MEEKVLFNSVISTPGSQFICAYIKYYFIRSTLERFEYIIIPIFWIPQEILTQYNLYSFLEPGGYVYCEITKGIYGFKKTPRLAFENLVKLLELHGYFPFYGNIRPDPQYLPFVLMILVSNPIQ